MKIQALVALLLRFQRPIITGALIAFTLGFFVFFRGESRLSPAFQSLIVAGIFFLVIPILYCRMVLKSPLRALGMRKGNPRAGIASGAFLVMLSLAAVGLLLLFLPAGLGHYRLPRLVESSFFWFVAYELVLVPFLVLLYEVFFRGFIQTLWLGTLGWRAVLIQTALFWGLFFLSGDFGWQNFPLLIFAPFAGFIAFRSRSLWYSFAASWLFLLLSDVLILIFR